MNHYTLAEMTPGLTESFTVTVTEEMMQAFERLTGDCSPIHVDETYAKARGLRRPGRVRHAGGELFLHTGRRLPARRTLFAARR